MKPGERIPLHDHSDFNSGGLTAPSVVITQLVTGGGSTGGGSGGATTAEAVSVADVAANFAGENVEAVLAESAANLTTHLTDATDAHDASAISIVDAGGHFTATDVEAALAELATTGGGGDTSGHLMGGFDGGGVAIVAGSIYYGVVPYSGTITDWRILGTPVGNVAFDVAVCAAGALPVFPGDSIVAAAPPSMTGDTEVSGSTLTGWATSIVAGNNYAVKVTSATAAWASLTLNYSRP